MAAYSELHTADLRLAVLQVLSAAGDEMNVASLKAALMAATPHRPGTMQLRNELAWLAARNLVVLRAIGATIGAATIAEAGEDVALGAQDQPGVAQPDIA